MVLSFPTPLSEISQGSNLVRLTFRLSPKGLITPGIYSYFGAHNVEKVRVVKYIVIYGQIKAADQIHC